MSEDKSNKTEQPTPKRLRDARRKGQVAKSREVISTLLIFSCFIFFWFSWPHQIEQLKKLILLPASFYQISFQEALKQLVELLLWEAVYLVLPLIGLVIGVALVANLLQFGFLFAVQPILPKMEKINPINGTKRIFSARTAAEAVKSVFKILIISVLLIFVINNSLSVLIKIPYRDIYCLTDIMSALTWQIVIYLIPGFFIIAVLDYVFQRAQYMNDNKMTKEEIKKEYKNTEGDPIIKGRRNELHHQLTMENTLQTVKSASVLVTGSQVAVALWYDKNKTPLPVVLGIGKQLLAKRMIHMAQTGRVPIIEDLALAQGLAEKASVEQYIPKQFVEASAVVIRWAMKQSTTMPVAI